MIKFLFFNRFLTSNSTYKNEIILSPTPVILFYFIIISVLLILFNSTWLKTSALSFKFHIIMNSKHAKSRAMNSDIPTVYFQQLKRLQKEKKRLCYIWFISTSFLAELFQSNHRHHANPHLSIYIFQCLFYHSPHRISH